MVKTEINGSASGQTTTGLTGPSVFISYRREDSLGHAGRLHDLLRRQLGRKHVFFDIKIPGGAVWDVEIDNAVGACDFLLAVIGTRWLAVTDDSGRRRLDNPADWVRVEIASALARNVRVIPVLVQGARMPTREDLPDELAGLARRQALELSDRRPGARVTTTARS